VASISTPSVVLTAQQGLGLTLHNSVRADALSFNKATAAGRKLGMSGTELVAIQDVGVTAATVNSAPVTMGSANLSDASQGKVGPLQGEVDRDPFHAMDLQNATHTWPSNSASPRELSVGYRDSDLGYVELRAQQDGSGVHASLVAQSAASEASLHAQLADLGSWLNARHTPVESLHVLAQSSSTSSNSGGQAGEGQSANSGTGSEAQGGSSQGWNGSQANAMLPQSSIASVADTSNLSQESLNGWISAPGPAETSSLASGLGRGGIISLMA